METLPGPRIGIFRAAWPGGGNCFTRWLEQTWYTVAMARRGSSGRSGRSADSTRPAKPTIRAVADRAGVAISTVSRVLNGGPVSELLKRKVLKAVGELGYVPSVAAQSLVRRRSGCIGLAVNTLQSAWFSQILVGVEEGLAPSRKSVLLSSWLLHGQYDPEPVRAWIQHGRVDGIILVRHSKRDHSILEAAQRAELPVVLLAPDRDEPSVPTVRCNNVEAGRLAGVHLTDFGHKRFAFAGGPRDSVDTRMRLAGLQDALQERGISLPSKLIWFGSEYGSPAGAEFGAEFLRIPKKRRPTAVVLGNDTMAMAFMRCLLSNGIQIPGEVSVLGFDGTPDGAQYWPGLTTVEQPTRQMATHACAALLEQIESPSNPHGTSTEFPVTLLARESTAIAAT